MNNDQTMQNFIHLSAVLTGFNASILAPDLDPVNIKAEYLPFFIEKVGEPLAEQLFTQFANLKAKTNPTLSNQQIGQAMLDPSNGDEAVLACRKLIFMWYSGAWPTLIPATATAPASTVSDMISAKSYTCGLVWQVMQSHPMGDSNYRYGYWAKPPAPLSAYTGNDTSSNSN